MNIKLTKQPETVKSYEIVNVRTGESFGNHTYVEAVSRAQVMHRNWNYRERFEVRDRLKEIRAALDKDAGT